MANRVFRKTARAAHALLLLLLACAAGARAQEASASHSAAARLSDAQVVEDLTGSDEKKASRAAHEVLARGGRMIPRLVKLKGDRRCFRGDMELGSHAGGSFRLSPAGRDQCDLMSGASTVEVAALYLIEAVYRNGLKFAQGATLAQWDAHGEQRTDVKLNGRELVERAWADAELWFQDFERDGLEALRARGRAPFDRKRVGFY